MNILTQIPQDYRLAKDYDDLSGPDVRWVCTDSMDAKTTMTVRAVVPQTFSLELTSKELRMLYALVGVVVVNLDTDEHLDPDPLYAKIQEFAGTLAPIHANFLPKGDGIYLTETPQKV